MKFKVIRGISDKDFEKSLEEFVADKLDYFIQYNPVANHGGVAVQLALITYAVHPPEEN